MISKSTKKKWRRNKERIQKRKEILIHLIDRRCDFWLISYPTRNKHVCDHIEINGADKALKLHRILVSFT